MTEPHDHTPTVSVAIEITRDYEPIFEVRAHAIDTSDAAIAAALVHALQGIAATRGADLPVALAQRITIHDHQETPR